MTAADAPELLSRSEVHEMWKTFGPEIDDQLAMTAIAAYDDSGRLWRDVAADLAAKLAAAEREWEELLETAQLQSDRAIRAEAALVAAQEAMRTRCAVMAERRMDMALAASIRALPIPAAKPEGE